MRHGGFTLLEVMLALSVGFLVTLVVSGLLTSGFSLALAAEAEEYSLSASRALYEKILADVEEARGHEVFADFAAYGRNSPVRAGALGACLKLYAASGNKVWWWDAGTREVRWLVEAPRAAQRVGARNVQDFQVGCVASERVWLTFTTRPSAGGGVTAAPLTLSGTCYHRNYDGTTNSCQVPRALALAP